VKAKQKRGENCDTRVFEARTPSATIVPDAEVATEGFVDALGNPTGGTTVGPMFGLSWQHGPLTVPSDLNGAAVEDVLAACVHRLSFFQTAAQGKFACRENALALTKIEEALLWLGKRREDRKRRGVLGKHEV
jgi:hypothetical protein